MTHSPLCLWKKTVLSNKLRREATLDEVHMLCDELGFSSAEETIAFIEKASPAEIEAVIERRRKKRRRLLVGQDYVYVYAT